MNTNTTIAILIVELRGVFAAFGLPRAVVSDNSLQFVSAEFEKLMKDNSVKRDSSQ